MDTRSREHVIEPELQSLVHGADHAADMADVLVRGACADALGQNTIFPPVGIGQRIVAGQLMQRLVALLLDQDFDRALLGAGPFANLIRRHLRQRDPLRLFVLGEQRRQHDRRLFESSERGPAQRCVVHHAVGEQGLDARQHIFNRRHRRHRRRLVVETERAGELHRVEIGVLGLGGFPVGKPAPVGLQGLVHAGRDLAGLGALAVGRDLDLGRELDVAARVEMRVLGRHPAQEMPDPVTLG